MSRNSNPLDRLNISAPCSAEWDSMKGNDQIRFCEHCNLSVHNLSAMTRREVVKLVAASEGRLCARYYKRPNGKILTATSHQLHQIKRRASRLVAGAFTAALSLSASVNAQTPSPAGSPAGSNAEISVRLEDKSAKRQQDGAAPSIRGTITDVSGAVIPGTTLTLLNQETNQEQQLAANDEGKFSFPYLAPGAYTLKAEAPGFAPQLITNILVRQSGEQSINESVEVNATLEVNQQAVMGVFAVVTPRVPIVAAAAENNMAALRQLINAGFNVNVVDEDTNTTALIQAVGNGNLEMVDALLAAGADVNAKTAQGQTAVMMLDIDATAEMVWALYAAGARLNHKDEEGKTALMNVAALDNPSVMQALIHTGAKVNALNKEGRTALSFAAEAGIAGNVKVLLRAGADPNIKDLDGDTPLKIARENDHGEVVQLLESYGANE